MSVDIPVKLVRAERLTCGMLEKVQDGCLSGRRPRPRLRPPPALTRRVCPPSPPQGVSRSQQVDYELLPDEERQCLKCRTTCYLSGITCPCSPGKLVCLHHAQDLCSCPPSGYTLQ